MNDLDEVTRRLLEQEVEKTELEQYEKVDVELQKKPKLAEQLGDVSQQVETFEEATNIEAPVIVEEYTTERRASEIKETAEKLPTTETKKAPSKSKLSIKKPGEDTTEILEKTLLLIEKKPVEDKAVQEEVSQELHDAKIEEVTFKVDEVKPKRRRSIKKPEVESLPEEAPEFVEKIGEETSQNAELMVQETQNEEAKPESVEVKKSKTKKVIKKKKTDDLDEITQRLLEQEIERPELEQYEKVDVDIQKKEKPKVR